MRKEAHKKHKKLTENVEEQNCPRKKKDGIAQDLREGRWRGFRGECGVGK